jgi:hypothetical protein
MKTRAHGPCGRLMSCAATAAATTAACWRWFARCLANATAGSTNTTRMLAASILLKSCTVPDRGGPQVECGQWRSTARAQLRATPHRHPPPCNSLEARARLQANTSRHPCRRRRACLSLRVRGGASPPPAHAEFLRRDGRHDRPRRAIAFPESARPDLARSQSLLASAFAQQQSSDPLRQDDRYAANAVTALDRLTLLHLSECGHALGSGRVTPVWCNGESGPNRRQERSVTPAGATTRAQHSLPGPPAPVRLACLPVRSSERRPARKSRLIKPCSFKGTSHDVPQRHVRHR